MNYAFFPGGNGLYKGMEVVTFPAIETLILGSDFACFQKHVQPIECTSQFRLIVDPDERENSTWRNLRALLRDACIPFEGCFFTNAWPVLHLPWKLERLRREQASSKKKETNDNPPIDVWRRDNCFREACNSFFLQTIELLKPRLLIVLGKGPALFLGDMAPNDFGGWRFPETWSIDNVRMKDLDQSPVPTFQFGSNFIECVLVNHPSRRKANAENRGEIANSVEKEVDLLKGAADRAGIRRSSEVE